MGIAADVFYAIDDLGFKFNQWLNSHFVYFLECLSIYIFEVLGFELLYELRICAL